jgi:hypothetical protein
MHRLPLPYQKSYPALDDYKVELSFEEHVSPVSPGTKWIDNIYSVQQKRGSEWTILSKINTASEDMWGGQLKTILDNILPHLNNKNDYKWNDIKKIIVDFWHQKQEAEKQEDIASGGKGEWTIMGDFTFGQLMKFIATIFGLKWELLQVLPLNIESELVSNDALEKQISWQAFDEVIVRDKIQTITKSSLSDVEKVEQVVDFIIQHSHNIAYSNRRDLLDPSYNDETPLLSKDEAMELSGLFQINEKYEKQVNANTFLSPDEKKLKKFDFWETETGKRLDSLNNRRVHGATLSFTEKEERKRKTASNISSILATILSSWDLLVEDGQQYYFNLYTEEAWSREQKKIEMEALVKKGQSQTELMRSLIKGGWDSNTLTFFGVVAGIYLSALFGFFSLFSFLGLLAGGFFSISLTSLTFIIFIKFTKKFRVSIIKWAKSVLETEDKSKNSSN